MSARTKKAHDPLETLERILNKTTLTTQRVGHRTIIKLGNNVMTQQNYGNEEDREKAIQDALDAREARGTRELRAALHRLKQEKDAERQRALEKQREYYDRIQQRVSDARDKAEEERLRELSKEKDREKEEALKEQWEECERLKVIAIEEACVALKRQLRNEFVLEKEKAVADALKIAREKFKIREQETILRTIRECEEKARKEAERVAKLHQKEIQRLNDRYDALQRKYDAEHAFRVRIESDFKELQDDYKRFMNYTDGKFHSDYLMRLRYLGMQLAEKSLNEVEYEDVSDLDLIRPSTSFV